MAEGAEVVSCEPPGEEEQGAGGEDGGGSEREDGGALSDAQREVLERCLHTLRHAQNDSHTLAALLLVSPDVWVHHHMVAGIPSVIIILTHHSPGDLNP